jgi:hypothetical protein
MANIDKVMRFFPQSILFTAAGVGETKGEPRAPTIRPTDRFGQ